MTCDKPLEEFLPAGRVVKVSLCFTVAGGGGALLPGKVSVSKEEFAKMGLDDKSVSS